MTLGEALDNGLVKLVESKYYDPPRYFARDLANTVSWEVGKTLFMSRTGQPLPFSAHAAKLTMYYIGSAPLDTIDAIRYSDLSAQPYGESVELEVPERLSGSDYPGNDGGDSWRQYEAFRSQAPGQGTLWWNVVGGHGTFSIAILPAALDDSTEWDTEEMADAASTVRDLVAALEKGEGIADDAAEFDQLADQTIVALNEDGFYAQVAFALINNGGDVPGQFEHLFDINEQEMTVTDNARTMARQEPADNAVLVQLMTNSVVLYHALSDLFGVYPSLEGSGQNVSAITYTGTWINKFNTALATMNEVMPWADEENTIASDMLLHLLTDTEEFYQHFEYGSPFYMAIANMYGLRSADERAVAHDHMEAMGIEAATKALLTGSVRKYSGLHE